MIRLLQAAVGLVVVAGIVAGLNWSSFHGLQMRYDLHKIAKQVRNADTSLKQKERILDQIDAIRDKVRHGRRPSWLSWWEVSDAVEDMTDWGIRGDEPRLIERELARLNREMDET